MKLHPTLRSRSIALGLAGALVLAACGDSSGADTSDHPFEGVATGVAQFGGDGNHDGPTNIMECRETEDVRDYFKVTTCHIRRTRPDDDVAPLSRVPTSGALERPPGR